MPATYAWMLFQPVLFIVNFSALCVDRTVGLPSTDGIGAKGAPMHAKAGN